MHDLLWGLGLFLIFEGLAYVLAPRAIEQMLALLASISIEKRRFVGICVVLIGAFSRWLARAFA